MAAPRCSICSSPHRDAVNEALVAGRSQGSLCREFGFSTSAMCRHWKRHLPQALVAARDAEIVADADGLVADIEALREKARSVAERAERAGELRTVLLAVREQTRIVELLARLAGELKTGNTTNVLIAPEWLGVREALFRALAPFPEARAAASGALLEIEAPA